MDAKNAILKIKELLFGKEEEVEITLMEAKLMDGTLISYESLEVGSVVNKINEDATIEPLGEGEYEMEDGSILVLDADSKVIEIKPAPVVEDEVTTEEMAEEIIEEVVEDEIDSKILAIEERIYQIEQAIQLILEQLTNASTEMSAVKEDLSKQIKEIAELPAATPAHFAKQDEKELTVAERRLELLNRKK